MLTSILINNHNYGRYVRDAIESALAQTHYETEVIVVDDGSTDDSRRIIEQFSDFVHPVFKAHGGQASAINAAYESSTGDMVFLLDADDTFEPEKVTQILETMRRHDRCGNTMWCHRLWQYSGKARNHEPKPDAFWDVFGAARHGDVEKLCDPDQAWDFVCQHRDIPYIGSPTSGIALTRSLAERVFPLPEVHPVGADCLLSRACAITGTVYGVRQVLARRRLHGANHSVPIHKHLADRRFMQAMRDYLNGLLVSSGRGPVLAF